jgi:hypothetical protein
VSHTLEDLPLVSLQSSKGTDSKLHVSTPRFRIGHAKFLLALDRDKELLRVGIVDVIAFRKCFFAAPVLTGRQTIA